MLEEAAESPAGQAAENWVSAGIAAGVTTVAAYGRDIVDSLKTASENGGYTPPGPYVGPLNLHADSNASSSSGQSSSQGHGEQSTTAQPPEGGGQGGQKQSSAGKMQKEVEKGQAPKSVDRVDKGRGPHEQDHTHFTDGHALNKDGTWKHGGRDLSKQEGKWLNKHGWSHPKKPQE